MDEQAVARCESIGRWRAFLDSLDTGGGQAFLLMFLICLGVGVFKFMDATAGGQVMTLSFGAYLAKIRDKGTNKEQLSGPPAVQAIVTTPQPPLPTLPGAGSAAPDGPEKVEFK